MYAAKGAAYSPSGRKERRMGAKGSFSGQGSQSYKDIKSGRLEKVRIRRFLVLYGKVIRAFFFWINSEKLYCKYVNIVI